MANKPWNPRRFKNEIADAIKEMHRLSCSLARETTAVAENQSEAQAIDIELIREGADDLKRCVDRLVLLWEVSAFPDENEDGILGKLEIL